MPVGIETAFGELGALSKQIYDTGVIDQEQRLTITYDELPTKNWNIRGNGWFGDAHLVRSSSFKFAAETAPLAQDTTETSQQFTITNVEEFGNVTFTKNFLTKLIGGVTSFEDYTYKIEDLQKSCKKNLNQSCYIGPRNIRATVAAGVVGSPTFTISSTQYIFNGMFVDFYNAAATTLVQNNVQITAINGNTISVTPNVTLSAGDTIFLHEENLATTTGLGFNSIPDQCDDGTDFPVVFEGISRTTFPGWRGNRIDALNQVLTNDLLQKGQNTIYEVGGNDYMTEDYVNFVHMNSVRRYISIILPQKRYIDASKYDSGMEKPNMLEWNGKPIVIDPDCGKNDWIMYNRTHGGKMEIAPLALESMFGGTSMKWKSGYMQGVSVMYYSGNLGTNKCNSNLIFRNLQPVS